MKLKAIFQIYKVILFTPLLLYFGNRSYLAFDEGFYALQARWIIQNNNWIIPYWWDSYSLDRTIGIQFLIAKFQQLFGETVFVAHIPTTIASCLMLFLTFKLHQELLEKKEAIISAIILSTTYLWLDFAHLATQDMIFACLVTLGIYSLSKIQSQGNNIHNFIFGSWIGLAFMMKTFLVGVPIISFFPYIFYKRDIIRWKILFLGILIGFIPFFVWTALINQYLDKNIFLFLFDKLAELSSENNFTNPFYYYLWNIPINFLPWSLFGILGLKYQQKNKLGTKKILFDYPIIYIVIISIFSTKTPYYALPIASILSLNAYLGIKAILKNEDLKFLFINIISRILPLILLSIIFIYWRMFRNSLNLNTKEELFLIIGFACTTFIFILIGQIKKSKFILFSLIIGPYLMCTCIAQSGLITDRSRDLRESIEYGLLKDNLNNEIININISNAKNSEEFSKLIKISLLTPKLGKAIDGISNLDKYEFAWTIESLDQKIDKESFEIVFSDKNLNPWKIVKKKI